MISVQNRTPTPGKEGRVSIAQDNGNVIEGLLTMADGATDPGTPWNRNTANHLQAIRKTLPVAAGQTIAAGDVVNVRNGEVSKLIKLAQKAVKEDSATKDIQMFNTDILQLDTNLYILYYYTGSSGRPDYHVFTPCYFTSSGFTLGSKSMLGAKTYHQAAKMSAMSKNKFIFIIGSVGATEAVIQVGSVSDTRALTFANSQTITDVSSNYPQVAVVGLSESLAVVFYCDYTNTNGYSRRCTVTGNTISLGSPYRIIALTNINFLQAIKVSDTSFAVFYMREYYSAPNTLGAITAGLYTISGASITENSTAVINTEIGYQYNDFGVAKYAADECFVYVTRNSTARLYRVKFTNNAVSVGSNITGGYATTRLLALSSNEIVIYKNNTAAVTHAILTEAAFKSVTEVKFESPSVYNSNLIVNPSGDTVLVGSSSSANILRSVEFAKENKSIDAVAIQGGTTGQLIDVVFSGMSELPGVIKGKEVSSDGVYYYSPLDGWIYVLAPEVQKAGLKIAKGSYTGTGSYGQSSPSGIALPFKPDLVFIQHEGGSVSFPWIRGARVFYTAVSSYSTVVQADRVFKWYSDIASNQLNTSGQTYVYVAVGRGVE